MATRTFFPFSISHWVVLAATLLAAIILIALRRRDSRYIVFAERALAFALLLNWPVSSAALYLTQNLNLFNALPFHLCDVAAFAGAIALLTRALLAAEMVYFFGLAGTLQGLITPALQQDFPHLTFFAFFLGHSGIVITALYIVVGLGITPQPHAPWRMLACLLTYAALVGGLNWLLGTNYGFVCAKPPSPSLMDFLGSWPWYIGSLVMVAFVFFLLLNLPFAIQRVRKKEIALPSRSA